MVGLYPSQGKKAKTNSTLSFLLADTKHSDTEYSDTELKNTQYVDTE